MVERVLMSADTVGGVWNYAISLIGALELYDIEVALATMGAPLNDAQRQAVKRLSNVRLYESDYRLEWMPDPWPDVCAAGVWLRDIAAEFQPDVVHLNHYAHAGFFHEPTLVVAHSDVLSWWEAVKGEPAPPEWETYRQTVITGLDAADQVVAPTQAMGHAIQRLYRPHVPISVVPNGITSISVQGAAGQSSLRPTLLRHEALFAGKLSMVLAVGRLWDEAKNIDALCRVAPELDAEVFVVGADRHPHGQQTPVQGVRPLGFLDPDMLRTWYRRAAIYALPAYYEPFGLSILEAAAHGCALVLGAIPSLLENWHDAAVFVPPHDHGALHAALQHLIEDPALRRKYGQLALQRSQQFTLHRQARRYVQVYRHLEGRVRAA